MKKIFFFLMIYSLIAGCSPTKRMAQDNMTEKNTTFSNTNDGSSYEKAVIIDEKSETSGINAEYSWLRQYYPGYTSKGQALNFYKNKPYDIITILTSDRVEKKIYFDISNFYGKF